MAPVPRSHESISLPKNDLLGFLAACDLGDEVLTGNCSQLFRRQDKLDTNRFKAFAEPVQLQSVRHRKGSSWDASDVFLITGRSCVGKSFCRGSG